MDIETLGQVEGINASSEEARPGGALGKDEFMSLLVAQMSNQDPLEPMDSQATIAQLAQFSALEQMQNVSVQLSNMRRETALINSMLLKDRTVTAQLEGGEEITGIVEKVSWGLDGVVLTIGGQDYKMQNLVSLSIAEEQVQAPLVEEPVVV